ncbi:MAG: ABC transporter ATP-binding protein [Elainellaceae cyanobacterium]
MSLSVQVLKHAPEQTQTTLLKVADLQVTFKTDAGFVHPVHDISFTIERGRTLAILGESGSGKSMLMKTILGIQSPKARVSGNVWVEGRDLLALSAREREEIRGSRISMIFQNPMTALDPVFTIEAQLIETLQRHRRMSRSAARQRALELLRLVQIASPEQRLKAYPFEMSGGMRQRIVIAMALACNPSLLLADEPTTALDVTVQARVLELLRSLQKQLGMSIIIVTHDVAVAAEMADDVIVMYAGRVVERAPARELFRNPQHPYTRGLLEANVHPGQRQRPKAIPGLPPHLARLPQGCAFAPRCSAATDTCWNTMPSELLVSSEHSARCLLLNDRP